MKFRKKRKSASITVEFVLAISFTLLVLFIVIGKFNDNLSTMATKGGMNNITNVNTAKTTYTNYNRSYTSSTVSVP